MIDSTNPVVRRLRADGLRVSLHVYLIGDGLKVTYTASHPVTKRLIQGRSKGNIDEALNDLAVQAGLEALLKPEVAEVSI